ncbi:MAG TPA: ATP-binding protein [Steroidobacteraceae bacterium]|nr:ATP-binding protein [Steroidobacteraceae bacterium]
MIRSAFVATSNASRSLMRPWDRDFALAAITYLALYVALQWLSNVRPLLALNINPWNPQAGLGLAFLVLYGGRAIAVTAVAVLMAGYAVRGMPANLPIQVAASVWVAISYGGLAAFLREREIAAQIHTVRDAARLAGAAVGGTLIVAAGYVTIFLASRQLPLSDAVTGVTRYWIGDLSGVLTLTPLLINARGWREHLSLLQRHRWEMLSQFAAILLTLWIIFQLPTADQLRFFYLLFLPVIWIALRWGWRGAMLSVLLIQIGLIVAARTEIPTARLIDLQFLMVTLSLTGLLLGAAVAERAGVLRRVAMSEAEQRALLAMAPDAVLAVDPHGRVRMANAAASRLFGEGIEAGEAQLASFLPGLQLDRAQDRVTLNGRRADGSTFPAEIAQARLDPPANEGYLVTVRDATDRRRAEEQLRERDAALARAMRFAVAGELASALAHELNQPITALVSYLRASEILAAQPPGDGNRLQATLGKAAQEAIRASAVLRKLRDFYQGGARKSERVDIAALCRTVVRAFEDRLRRANASLIVSIDPTLPPVEADGTQLEIVLHNLIANALDSVSHVAGGGRQLELHGSHHDGVLTLRVADSGPGITAEVERRLFEPFVTSKPDGMGLGLAISRSLIRARGGELSCERSRKLGGAEFTIRLPIDPPSDTPSV